MLFGVFFCDGITFPRFDGKKVRERVVCVLPNGMQEFRKREIRKC